ncbi:MAG TPA: 2-methylcitrate dehydratase [Rhodospirillaceae bacterium]|nr:2-methylcitrate dehydratase [Rhodospirillaceae bacterium]
MKIHTVKAEKKSGSLKKEDQLAWKLAKLAADTKDSDLDADVVDMVKNRIIDNAAIALAALNEDAVVVARDKALASKGAGLATVYGLPPDQTFGPREAAFVNAVAVRFRDQDDTYLAAEYSHPDDNISPLLAVAQQLGIGGKDLIRGIAVAYEVHVALVGTGNGTGICLHKHKVDHMTHIAAASAAGFGAMLKLPMDQIYHTINFAVHNAISSRQSRKGDIGAQKEFVPGFCAEISIDALNSAMHGLKGPNPVYEGEDSIIRRFLDGKNNPDAEYKVELAEPGDKLRNIMMTYPKEHAFEYQGQAIIDMALEMVDKMPKKDGRVDWSKISGILLETSHHTDHVIGTGANDPQKIDPDSPRGTLDHSIMFAIARSMQLGRWDEDVYDIAAPEKEELRAAMAKVKTVQVEEWERRYHSTDPKEQSFGGKLIVTLADGTVVSDEKACANAHPLGKTPWKRPNYIKKLEQLTKGLISDAERKAFLANVDKLEALPGAQLGLLTPKFDAAKLEELKTKGVYNAVCKEGKAVLNDDLSRKKVSPGR